MRQLRGEKGKGEDRTGTEKRPAPGGSGTEV
jgi:hypothetical protein